MGTLKTKVRWPVMASLTIGMLAWGSYVDGPLNGLLMALSPWVGFVLRALTDDLRIT